MSNIPSNRNGVHPGTILREEFMLPNKLSQRELARRSGIRRTIIRELYHDKGSISADTAYHLANTFNTSEQFWKNLQDNYDKRK